MKVLLVGGGAREHALAWRLLQENPAVDLIAAMGGGWSTADLPKKP